jgi:hypothetical protein
VPKTQGQKSKVLNRRTNKIVIKNSRTGDIKGEIYTKETQFGTPNLKVRENPALKTFGDARFYNGLSGSLTRLTDGRSYLVAGSGISITSGSNDQVIITAGSINPAEALSFGNGFDPYGTSYNGTTAKSVSLLAKSNGGLGVNSSGNFISPGNLPSTVAATTRWELIVSDGSTPYRSTINDVLALGVSSGITLSNPLTLNSSGGIRDTFGASQYDNSTIVDLALKIENNKGLDTTTSGLKIDPSNLTSVVASSGDKVVIGDVSDSDNVKYVTAQSIADLASIATLTNTLNIGAGLNPSGSNFDGSANIDVKVLEADSTISVTSSGVSVLKVPNSASNGNGISSFTFDGSAGSTISAQTTANRGLQVTTSGIELDIDNLPSAYAETDDYLLIYDISNVEERKTTINNFRSDVILSLDNTYSGINNFTAGLSGSLTQLSDGRSYLVAGNNVTITSESNGQITIAASGGGGGGSPGGANTQVQFNDAGSFGGDAGLTFNKTTNVLTSLGGISGSITQLSDGRSYLAAGSNVTISSESNGQITISSIAGSSEVAVRNKEVYYVTSSHPAYNNLYLLDTDFSVADYDPDLIDVILNGNLLVSGTIPELSSQTVDYTVTSFNTLQFSQELRNDDIVNIKTFESGSAGSAGVDSYFVTWQDDPVLTNEKVISGSSGIQIALESAKVIITTDPTKVLYNLTGSLPSSYILTVPGINFQENNYDYHKTDVYLNGNLLVSGSGEDYVLGSGTSEIYFNFGLLNHDSLLFKLS